MAWRRIERLSPNREPRRQGRRPDMLIMHYTAGASGLGTAQYFASKSAASQPALASANVWSISMVISAAAFMLPREVINCSKLS